jgi:hypothetical protein
MKQHDLTEWRPPMPEARQDGPDLTDGDQRRLGAQAQAVFNLMSDGEWRTLHEISAATGYPEASCSSRLRDYRKPRFGAHHVERRRRTEGTWEYRVGVPDAQP